MIVDSIFQYSLYIIHSFSQMTEPVKLKLGENAKVLRFVSRAEMFKQRRKTYDELDYLKYYQPCIIQAILHSMQAPIPDPLPPLSLTSISFYRRKSQPLFRTRNAESSHLQRHMIYESLWILASIDQKQFQDFQSAAKEFQRDLPIYLQAGSSDIREMAVIAAGNKIIGKQQQILSIVKKDPKQLWVLANHIYDNKISFRQLFPYLATFEELAFKTLFELTLTSEKELTETIIKEEGLKEVIVAAIRVENETIRKLAMRIVGNIVAESNEYSLLFIDCNILDNVFVNLSCASGEVRRDACWLLSNLSVKKTAATQLIRHANVIAKLVDLFSSEAVLSVKKEVTYIFCYMAHFAQKNEVFTLLAHENVLKICHNQLCLEDTDLSIVTLFLLKEMLELGDNFKGEEETNFFVLLIRNMQELYQEISKLSYSQNNEISSISIEITNYFQQEQY